MAILGKFLRKFCTPLFSAVARVNVFKSSRKSLIKLSIKGLGNSRSGPCRHGTVAEVA